jgi:hypothetical protein
MRYVIFAILVTILTVPSSAFAERWELETVDTGYHIFQNGKTTAVDKDGNPHVFYTVDDELKYGYYDGSKWVFSYIEYNGYYPGIYKSLALDSSNKPHVAYTTGHYEDTAVNYAYFNGSEWHTEVVDSEENVYLNSVSIAVDQNDNPVISYGKKFDYWGGVAYAYKDDPGVIWIKEEADSEGGRSVSMTIDPTGYPHISHCTFPHGDDSALMYTYKDGLGWHPAVIDDDGDLGFCSTIAVDSTGNPHIAYYKEWPQYETKYAYWDGSSWHTECIYDAEEFIDLSIALDSVDNPRVLSSHFWYMGSGMDRHFEIVYLTSNGAEWTESVIYEYIAVYDEDDEGSSWDCSLTLDGLDLPHVAFCRVSEEDYNDDKLIYARWIVAPSKFDLISPPKFAEVIEPVVFDWEDSTSSAGEVTYDFFYSTEHEFETYERVSGLIESTYTSLKGTFEEDVRYFWKVRAFDGSKETWSSDVFYFTVNEFNPPKAYALYYPRPNPSRYSAIICFDIPETAIVKLVLYDLTGRVVSVVVDEVLTTGAYEREISGLMPGVYLYRLEADNIFLERFTAVRKMVVIR